MKRHAGPKPTDANLKRYSIIHVECITVKILVTINITHKTGTLAII